MPESEPRAIALANQYVSRYSQDPNWQRTWLEMEAIGWRSIAVIPTDETSSLDAVHALAAIAWQQRSHVVVVADIRTIGLPVLSAVRTELRRRISSGERVLIATGSLLQSPAAATIAREADGAVICITLGKSRRKSVDSIIKEIGRNRIIGSITLKSRHS